MDEQEEHESYGMVGFSRIQCSHGEDLFGSAIKHQNTVRLRISTARATRNLNSDRFSAKKTIVDVSMSQSQFAELITSMNMGDGVPCTINYRDGKRMEECPHASERQKLDDDFRSQMEEVGIRVKNYQDAITKIVSKKGSLTIKDRETIANSAQMLKQAVDSDLPFMRKCYEESIDKSMTQAKAEIEAFVLQRHLDRSEAFSLNMENDKQLEDIKDE